MKAALILSLTAMLIAGITATPANAQSLVDTSNILVNPNAPPNAPLSVEQDEFITSIKDKLSSGDFNTIIIGARITIILKNTDYYIMKPIVDWTQRDFMNFDKEAQRFDEYLNELQTGYLFGILFSAEGGSDGGGSD